MGGGGFFAAAGPPIASAGGLLSVRRESLGREHPGGPGRRRTMSNSREAMWRSIASLRARGC